MIKLNREEVCYIIRQEGNKEIIQLVDDEKFFLLQFVIKENIIIQAISPLLEDNVDLKYHLKKDNLFYPFLKRLADKYAFLYDSFKKDNYLALESVDDGLLLKMNKESYVKGDIMYAITKSSKKEDISWLKKELDDLKQNISQEKFYSDNREEVSPTLNIRTLTKHIISPGIAKNQ